MKVYIQANQRFCVQIPFCDTQETIYNFKDEDMANRYICMRVAKVIEKYINHREYILNRFGEAKLGIEKANALRMIRYKINGYKRWNYKNIPQIIKSMENDLIELLPRHTSRYWVSQSQLVYTIINWSHGRYQ